MDAGLSALTVSRPDVSALQMLHEQQQQQQEQQQEQQQNGQSTIKRRAPIACRRCVDTPELCLPDGNGNGNANQTLPFRPSAGPRTNPALKKE